MLCWPRLYGSAAGFVLRQVRFNIVARIGVWVMNQGAQAGIAAHLPAAPTRGGAVPRPQQAETELIN